MKFTVKIIIKVHNGINNLKKFIFLLLNEKITKTSTGDEFYAFDVDIKTYYCVSV